MRSFALSSLSLLLDRRAVAEYRTDFGLGIDGVGAQASLEAMSTSEAIVPSSGWSIGDMVAKSVGTIAPLRERRIN